MNARLILCALVLAGCAGTGGEYAPQSYIVAPQDSLYSIAWRFGLDYRSLARWNRIGSDYRISVGQILMLSAPAPAAAVSPPPPAPASLTSARSWQWPTAHNAVPQSAASGGILIAGEAGQAVRAANTGRVVYCGNGIRGYGNLIIIKHDEAWLTSYAHTQDSLVREGDQVAAGQLIAHMGEVSPHRAALYFEIRESGKPADALALLPK